MNFSYNWLSELVGGLEMEPKELDRLITMKTAESEGVHPVGAHLEKVCAARVVSAEPIEGTHLTKALVETGRYGAKTVVCGAPNCRAGMITAYVPSGTSLGGREISRAVVRGVESDGMLASGAELGLNRDNAGILDLQAAPGDRIPGCAPDWVIEIDNKSITHRPDLWGHFGMAREVAAITGGGLHDPVKPKLLPEGPSPIRVAIEDFTLCPRYSALLFENVTVQPSPLWLQYRLETIGLNPINNIVDVTNLLMAELAQPMHAFDADLLHGHTIFVKPAKDGEVFVALNGESYTLDRTNLVIADERGSVALGGVIGGMDSSINERTKRIVLESANFQASCIRKTSSKLKLRTDASMRFEKAQDPENTTRAIARAIELFQMVSPGIRIAGGVADSRRPPVAPKPIELPLDWLGRKLGRQMSEDMVQNILERLQFGVREVKPRVFSVTVPSWRATKDVSIKDDLVEEIGRMIGYSSIPPTPPEMPVTVPPVNEERLFERRVRAMTAAQGFAEVYNYSFLSEAQAEALGFRPEDHVRVANPIASDQVLMRTSLLPGIYKNVLENMKHFETFRLFEVGREIHRRSEGLPDEIPHLAAALYEKAGEAGALMELKRLAECLMPGAEVAPAEPRGFEHPVRAAAVIWHGETLGRLFEFHPSLVSPGRAAVLDIDLLAMQRIAAAQKVRFQPIRRYPASAFDLSVVAGARELTGVLQKKIADLAGGPLEAIEFVRSYSGPPIPEGKQSISYRLTVAAQDRTLSLEEAGAIRQRIIDGLREQGYELRV